MRFNSVLLVHLGLSLAVTPSAFGALFTGLGDLPGGAVSSQALGISGDGTTVFGRSNTPDTFKGFVWQLTSGMSLFELPQTSERGPREWVAAASFDGSTIAAYQQSGPTSGVGFVVSGGAIVEEFDDTPNADAIVQGLSSDGSVAVGTGRNGNRFEAFRWTLAGGVEPLGFLPAPEPFLSSRAYGVSADGSLIVGGSTSFPQGEEAFLWTQEDGITGLGDLPGGVEQSQARAVSADGTTVVGSAHNERGRTSFYWTREAGMVALHPLGGPVGRSVKTLDASDVSGDGSAIVGTSIDPGSRRTAFIWTKDLGVRNLQRVLVNDFGLSQSLQGWYLRSATAISDDGLVIAGTGYGPDGNLQAWVAIIPEPSSGATWLLGVLLSVVSNRRYFFRRSIQLHAQSSILLAGREQRL